MPRAQSDMWRHFTAANVERKAVYICKYCAKSYVKDAIKMQNHGQAHKDLSALTTSNLWQKTSIRGENDESDTLSILTAHGPPGIRRFFFNQWRNVVREMLMNVLLKLCIQLLHLWCSQAMCIGRDSWMFFTQHTPLQPDMLYLLICWMQSSTEFKWRSSKS